MQRSVDWESFLKDVQKPGAEHVIEVIKDDELYRHLRFKRPGTTCMHFDIVTWPGHLAYSGDMGSYTFTRLWDMFEFFRRKVGDDIDFRYWAEKCIAADNGDGIEKWSRDAFGEATYDFFVNYCEGRDDLTEEDVQTLAADLQSMLRGVTCEFESYTDVGDFLSKLPSGQRVMLDDFYEYRVSEYSHRFLWCCHAIAWGIEQYDNRPELPANTYVTLAQAMAKC